MLLIATRMWAAEPAPEAKPPDQVLLHVKAIEISLTKLRAIDIDARLPNAAWPAKLRELAVPDRKPASREAVDFEAVDGRGVERLIHALCKEKVAKILAEPSLVTVDGRPAFYRVGGEVPMPPLPAGAKGTLKPLTFGTEINFVPKKITDRRIAFELRARIAHLDPRMDMVVAGQRMPGIREVMVDTGFEADFGQTVVLAGLVQERTIPPSKANPKEPARELVATVFLVKPMLVDSAKPECQLSVRPSASGPTHCSRTPRGRRHR
jgi:pilus assembly protein CpaC